jgi:uncharacterized membrane protein YbhN (UPF0104 family)
MDKPMTKTRGPRWLGDPARRRSVLRIAGLVVGLALFGLAIHFAMRERDKFAQALEALRDPPPEAVALVLASILVGALLTSLLFHILMRRFARIPFWEMAAIIAASTVANYLPLKPGFVGRVAYHRVRHGIRATHTLRTILEAIALSGTVASLFLLALVALRTLARQGVTLGGHPIEGEWALLAPTVLGLGVFVPRLRTLAQALLVRQGELALWTLRYWAVFQLVGAPVELETAIVLGSVSVIATLIPGISNGLGVREIVIGFLAPWISQDSVSTSEAVVAELVHRAAELTVMVPLGLTSIYALFRHNTRLALAKAETATAVESAAGERPAGG